MGFATKLAFSLDERIGNVLQVSLPPGAMAGAKGGAEATPQGRESTEVEDR